MVAVDGTTSRILGLKVMSRPENNAVAIDLLLQLTKNYPKLKTVVHDRACSLLKQAKRNPGLKKIKKYVIDKFHAHRHSRKCVASPIVHRNLARAIAKTNTSAAEQTFAWLKRYATCLNTMSAESHEFFLLAFCRMHNDLMGGKWAPDVLGYRKSGQKKSRKYGC